MRNPIFHIWRTDGDWMATGPLTWHGTRQVSINWGFAMIPKPGGRCEWAIAAHWLDGAYLWFHGCRSKWLGPPIVQWNGEGAWTDDEARIAAGIDPLLDALERYRQRQPEGWLQAAWMERHPAIAVHEPVENHEDDLDTWYFLRVQDGRTERDRGYRPHKGSWRCWLIGSMYERERYAHGRQLVA